MPCVNRETKRLLQRQGQVGADGQPARRERTAPAAPVQKERTPPGQFIGEVRSELKKVAWPTRPEVMNYTVVVLITLVVMTALTFGFDFIFAKSVLFLFER